MYEESGVLTAEKNPPTGENASPGPSGTLELDGESGRLGFTEVTSKARGFSCACKCSRNPMFSNNKGAVLFGLIHINTAFGSGSYRRLSVQLYIILRC